MSKFQRAHNKLMREVFPNLMRDRSIAKTGPVGDARSSAQRGDGRICAPVPSADWLELARQAYLKRYYAENGDDYENSTNVYGG